MENLNQLVEVHFRHLLTQTLYLSTCNNKHYHYPSLKWKKYLDLIRQTSYMVISSQEQTQRTQLKTLPTKATFAFLPIIIL